MTSPETNAGESPSYWTHNVKDFPSPVAQFRMAQLVDFDGRLYDTARTVYRFMVGWYMDDKGDALLSQRHVAKVMKQRAPAGAIVPSRNSVQRAILVLMEKGWVVRTFEGRGRSRSSRSRYVPVANVLELATQGKFPRVAPSNGPAECDIDPAHANGPRVAHANGPIAPEPAHVAGHQTLLPDSGTNPTTGNSNVSGPMAAGCLAAPAAAGFEKIWIAYDRLGNKAAARAEFSKLIDPDVDHIAARAASWAASARPGRRRMPLEKWLAAEKYDEADRRVEPKPERKFAQPEPEVPEPANDDAPQPWPVGEFVGQFVEGGVTDEHRETIVTMSFRVDAPGDHFGLIYEHRFWLTATVQSYQDEGQATMKDICRALGLRNVDDTDLLLGKPLIAISNGAIVAYRAVSQLEAA